MYEPGTMCYKIENQLSKGAFLGFTFYISIIDSSELIIVYIQVFTYLLQKNGATTLVEKKGMISRVSFYILVIWL